MQEVARWSLNRRAKPTIFRPTSPFPKVSSILPSLPTRSSFRKVEFEWTYKPSRPADPKSNDDFELISPDPIPSLDYSYVCLEAPPLPGITDDDHGRNATLQFRYRAPYHFHSRHDAINETFYLCSDVRLVRINRPIEGSSTPCFNVSRDWRGGSAGAQGQSLEGRYDAEGRGGSMGVVVGVGIVAGVAWFFWRRRKRRRVVRRAGKVGKGG